MIIICILVYKYDFCVLIVVLLLVVLSVFYVNYVIDEH